MTAEQITRARARWKDDAAPDSAARRLFVMAERIVTEPKFAAPLDEPLSGNLFVAQGILFESALAFRLSGDERFAEPVRRLLVDLADEPRRRARLPGEVHLGFVLVGLAVAAELCDDAIDQTLVRQVAADIGTELFAAAQRERWGDRSAPRHAWNHAAVGFTALGCAGLLCAGNESADRWTADAVERLIAFFAHGVTETGMTREGLAYCGFVFRNAAPFLLACHNTGVFDYRSPTDNPHVERLRRVPRWYAIEMFPTGSWLQNVNDSDWDPRQALWGFLPVFAPLAPNLVAWVHHRLVGTAGDRSHGQDPRLRTSALFETVLWPPDPAPEPAAAPDLFADPDHGYVAERVAGRRPSGFSLSCGRYLGSIHDQSDNGSVTFFAHDVPLLIDSGAANSPVEGSPSSSHGHNVVLIDGRGQRPAGAGAGVTATIVRAERSPAATLITADLKASYSAADYNPVGHAVRHCLYGKRPFPYLVLVDDFARPNDTTATFDQLFHTPPAAEVRPGPGELDLLIAFARASSRLRLRALDECAAPAPGTLASGQPPWTEHPVWRFRRHGRHVIMGALLLPFQDGEQPPDVDAHLDTRLGRVTLRWRQGNASGIDTLVFRPGTATPAEPQVRPARALLPWPPWRRAHRRPRA